MRQIEKLTFRQYEVAYLIYQGWSRQEIANYFFVDIRTIESHMYFIFKKLSISSAVEVVSFFHFKGIPDYGNTRCQPTILKYNNETYTLTEWAKKKEHVCTNSS